MRRTMGSISSTVSQLLLCLSTALYVSAESQQHQIISGHPVTGKLLLPEGTASPSKVKLILTLDGGDQQLAWARPDSSFKFLNVPAGSHLLDVVAMGLIFPQVRLDLDTSGLLTASLVEHPLTLMPRPLLLRPLAKAEYFEPGVDLIAPGAEVRQPFNPKSFLMSPMGLAMAFGIFSLVVMPMLKVDPEEAKELFGKKEGASDAKQVQAPEKPQLTQKQSRGQKKHN